MYNYKIWYLEKADIHNWRPHYDLTRLDLICFPLGPNDGLAKIRISRTAFYNIIAHIDNFIILKMGKTIVIKSYIIIYSILDTYNSVKLGYYFISNVIIYLHNITITIIRLYT